MTYFNFLWEYKKNKKCRNCSSKNIKFIYKHKEEFSDAYLGHTVETYKYYDIFCNECKYIEQDWNDCKVQNLYDNYRIKVHERAKNIFKIRKKRKLLCQKKLD
jgi:hypothetical protein